MKSLMLKLTTAIFLLQTSLLANYQSIYIPDQLRKDISEGKVAKYQREAIPTVNLAELKQKGVVGASETLTRSISGTPTFDAILAADVCKVEHPQAYTSTIYALDLPSGVITCMYGAVGDLYNPMGLYKVFIPEVKAYYSINSDAAQEEKAAEVANAEAQFAPLIEAKKNIMSQQEQQGNATFLTIPELLYAAILTDEEIIDIDAAYATGKFQLKPGYSSKFTESGEVVDNSEYLLTDSVGIFKVYAGLADVSMNFLLIITAGFGAYGVIRYFGGRTINKVEKKKSNEANTPYILGLMAGIILFVPQSIDTSATGEYQIMHNHYQEFEKFGYYTFNDWAKQAAKVIIDTKLDNVIANAGLGTKEQIVDTTAQATQAQRLDTFYSTQYNTCANSIYKNDYLLHNDGKTVFGESDKSMFPSTEHWAYVAFAAKSLAESPYETGSRGVLRDGAAAAGQYPKLAFSSCGKADALSNFYAERKNQLQNNYNSLVTANASVTPKIQGMEKVIEFQYKLYRDWGFLSILALPISSMQAEQIAGTNHTASNKLLEKMNQNIKGDDQIIYSILSSIPYMYVPGASTVFDIVNQNSIAVGAASGAAIGAQAGGDNKFMNAFYSVVGAIDGAGIAAVGGGGLIALGWAYMSAKTTLMLLPILGLVIIGILRFIIIIIKGLSYHFLSLFIMPVMFLQKNLEAMSKFTAKVLATMLELPIFVLAVFLAMEANSMIHTLGTIFSKTILSEMVNNDIVLDPLQFGSMTVAGESMKEWASKMTIFLFDGLFEVAIGIFSIIIIYKIIITLHTELFQTIDLSTSSAIDNAVESMRTEGSSWGTRI